MFCSSLANIENNHSIQQKKKSNRLSIPGLSPSAACSIMMFDLDRKKIQKVLSPF